MKYWRGYLTAAIIAAFTWALASFADTHRNLVDMVYPYVSRLIQTFLAQWSSGAAFCLWQLGAIVLVVCLLASIVLMILLRWNPIQWLGWVLAGASLLVCLHTGIYGLNAYAGPLAEDIRLETAMYTQTELETATAYYRDKANDLAAQIRRDGSGAPLYPSFQELALQAGEGFQTLTYEQSYSIFAGSTVPVKELGWADLYTSMGVSGVTVSLTGEAAVNPNIPTVSLPFAMCREMARRMCIVSQRDADFSAFLACRANSSVEFRYSAYFMAYRYCLEALESVSTEAARRVHAQASSQLQQDMASYDAFFSDSEQGDAGSVCQLLVSWHIQQIVLPQQVVTEEKFDPYDETQVDLSGLVNDPDNG